MTGKANQITMERFLKRKSPAPPARNDDVDNDVGNDVGTSRSRSRTDHNASNINQTIVGPSRVSRKDVNLNELPYDPADRRRITDYIGHELQDDVRRKYLIRGPCKPPPGFNFPQRIIAGVSRRCQHEWFTDYEYYKYDCLNPIIDLQLVEFNDRFNEVNSNLLTHVAAFNPRNSFNAFSFESLIELAKLYPDDFDPQQLKELGHELPIYIDNVRADLRFANLKTISELNRVMVDTRKNLAFPMVYRLLKLVLILPIATATVERCFSAMKIVKTVLRNRIGDEFMNDCIVCFTEPEMLATIPNDDVIVRFHKMKNHNRREKL